MNISTIDKGLAESLKKEFKTEDISLCLLKVGVLKEGEVLQAYHDISAWQRGGAETYNTVATITVKEHERKFIAKALVSMVTKPEQQLANWSSRRTIIQQLGIKTPKLFAELNGVIYEEFIDNNFSLDSNLQKTILEQLAFIAGQLDRKGFTTLSFINDIRLKDTTLYYVDFGSDLGEPSQDKKDSAIKLLMSKLTNEQLSVVRPIYDKILSE